MHFKNYIINDLLSELVNKKTINLLEDKKDFEDKLVEKILKEFTTSINNIMSHIFDKDLYLISHHDQQDFRHYMYQTLLTDFLFKDNLKKMSYFGRFTYLRAMLWKRKEQIYNKHFNQFSYIYIYDVDKLNEYFNKLSRDTFMEQEKDTHLEDILREFKFTLSGYEYDLLRELVKGTPESISTLHGFPSANTIRSQRKAIEKKFVAFIKVYGYTNQVAQGLFDLKRA